MLDCISKFSYTQYMFTLTNASHETRAIFKWGLIVIIIIALAFAIFRIGLIIKEMLYPTPPPPPTVLFGKLPAPVFPQNQTSEELIYKIETISGNLPQIASQTKVYTIALPKPDLLALDNAKQKVKAERFDNGPFKVSDIVYDWSTNGDLPKTIRLNIETFNFEVTSNFLQDPDAISGRNVADEKSAIEKASDFLSSMGYSSTDLDFETPLVNFFTVNSDGTFVKATSLSNTQIVQVNFFKKNIGDLSVYNEKPTESNVNVLLASGGEIVGASFVNPEISQEFSTYPLKIVDQAFDELKNKKAYIASYFGTGKNVSINDAFLAYYISKNERNFVYPIIVFTGNDGFFAYVNAVTDEWIEN